MPPLKNKKHRPPEASALPMHLPSVHLGFSGSGPSNYGVRPRPPRCCRYRRAAMLDMCALASCHLPLRLTQTSV